MPLYGFKCKECGGEDERFISLAEFGKTRRQRCLGCGGAMVKMMGVPQRLNTDSQLMATAGVSNDGLPDDASRKIAYAKARAAGVNISGKRFCPGLCRRGVPFDPVAWYGSESEVKQKAERLGRCVEGRITHTSPVRDEDYAAVERPYCVSADAVQEEVKDEINQNHGGKVSRKKRREITEAMQEKHTPKRLRPTGQKVELTPG